MKISKILSYIASAILSAMITLSMFGLLYQSYWSLDGVNIESRDSEFVQENFDKIREMHTVDFNQVISIFSNNTSSIIPLIEWSTNPGGFAAPALIILIAIFLLIMFGIIYIGNRIMRRFQSTKNEDRSH